MSKSLKKFSVIGADVTKMADTLKKRMSVILTKGPVISLVQANFTMGTVVIAPDHYVWTNVDTGMLEKVYMQTDGYVFKLEENIVFNPNSAAHLGTDYYSAGDVQPYQISGYYNPMAFGIGFFAAIALSAKNCVIDLNSHSISQGQEHALQQRFFAIIELASAPFIASQGPHSFGRIGSAEGCAIINGCLGLSAHHSIHGNLCRDIIIQNVTCSQHEVAMISINGGHNIVVENCTSSSHRTDLAVLGIWSAARFIRPYIDRLAAGPGAPIITVNGASLSATEVRDTLRTRMNTVASDILVTSPGYTTDALFENPHRRIDGNTYGIVFNGKGAAVNGFPADRRSDTRNVFLRDVRVMELEGWVNEVPAIGEMSTLDRTAHLYSNGKHENDPVGAVFQTQNRDKNNSLLTVSETGVYTGNPVANAQALVAKAIIEGFDFGPLSTKRNSISQRTLDWIEKKQTISEAGIDYIFNGDSMHHGNKGNIGMKLDQVNTMLCQNCIVSGVRNLTPIMGLVPTDLAGYVPSSTALELYTDYKNGLDRSNTTNYYYGNVGLAARGISLASSIYCVVQNVTVQDVRALHGPAIGCDIHLSSKTIGILGGSISEISAAENADYNMWNNNPTQEPTACGIRVQKDVEDIYINEVHIDGYRSCQPTLASPVRMESMVCTVVPP